MFGIYTFIPKIQDTNKTQLGMLESPFLLILHICENVLESWDTILTHFFFHVLALIENLKLKS